VKTPKITVKDLDTAREIFGTIRDRGEQALVAEIQKAAYGRKNKEVMDKIQNNVIWENGKSGAVDKMSRILFALRDNPVIRENEELSEFLDKQMQTLSPVIITQAQKTLDHDPEKQSVLAGRLTVDGSPGRADHPAVEGAETTGGDRTEEGLHALIMAMEDLDEFTDLHVFAGTKGFQEHEEKRLERIMDTLGDRGNFIFLEKERLLLGQGRLKPLIRKAFDEYTAGKNVSVNPHLLKKAWDFVRTRPDLQTQLRLIGVSSQEERSDLFKELERMLGPQTSPALKLSKQKLFSQKPGEAPEAGAPERSQAAGATERAQTADAPSREKDAYAEAAGRRLVEARGTHASHPGRRKAAVPRVKHRPKSKPAPQAKKISYNLTMQKYVAKSYAPLITDYMKRMYKHKMDFFIPLGEKRQYYTQEVLRRSVEGILRKDAKGRVHTDLLHSLKQDERLFAMILQELFIRHKSKQGQILYFPRFLKGEIEIA
jgi:hypothetical protein